MPALAANDRVGGDRPSPDEAQRRLLAGLEEGVLKVMSKMGISDVASYRGARLFEAVGLDRNLCRDLLAGTPSAIGGARLERFEREALERLEASHAARPQLENPGYVKFRKGGEPHATDPDVVTALQEAVTGAHALRTAVRDGRSDLYDRFAALVNDRAPLEPRDLLELVPAGAPVPLDEVEPAESIVRRFSGGAMSHGALSAEAHETIAIALNGLGARSNSGEGGEDASRFRDDRNSRIKQVASGRFGVTAEYAVFADELQIKIAQGSKPGEGGQIPAHKVSEEIARLRRAQPGVSLISPPPHHDIYSIEDLAQLIFDLREVSPHADISVKLVAETGVGIVAAGVAKAHADVVHVGGADGGTGASPLPSIKHAGVPWEVGLAEVQQALVANHLRARVRVRADGGFKTGRDVVVAALLGADEYSFGTALLLAEGCLMVRSCHLDTCPVGIATQQPELRAKFAGTPEMVRAYLLFVAEEVRRLLASLGLRSLDEAVGRVECLRQRHTGDPVTDTLDLTPLLGRGAEGAARYTGETPQRTGDRLGILLHAQGAVALDEAALIEPRHQLTNGDRAVGARLGGAVAKRFGSGAPLGRVRARFEGSAGQSFGAFLTAGVELLLVGEANDYVGKAMSGGRIVIAPPPDDVGDPCLVGNTALYGATGGQLFCAGSAGERFAVRNSGAVAVVEGVGDHACEYMTAGTVVVLGEVGLNFGAGMTGGEAYVLDRADELASRLNDELVAACAPDAAALVELRLLLERHVRHTGVDPRRGAPRELADGVAALRADRPAKRGRRACERRRGRVGRRCLTDGRQPSVSDDADPRDTRRSHHAARGVPPPARACRRELRARVRRAWPSRPELVHRVGIARRRIRRGRRSRSSGRRLPRVRPRRDARAVGAASLRRPAVSRESLRRRGDARPLRPRRGRRRGSRRRPRTRWASGSRSRCRRPSLRLPRAARSCGASRRSASTRAWSRAARSTSAPAMRSRSSPRSAPSGRRRRLRSRSTARSVA